MTKIKKVISLFIVGMFLLLFIGYISWELVIRPSILAYNDSGILGVILINFAISLLGGLIWFLFKVILWAFKNAFE